jgi:hypothetical protein
MPEIIKMSRRGLAGEREATTVWAYRKNIWISKIE